MKKILFTLFASLFLSGIILGNSHTKPLLAFSNDPDPIKFKISAGTALHYHLAKIDLTNDRAFRGLALSTSAQLGGGVLVHFQSNRKLFFQSGVLYEKRKAVNAAFVSVGSDPFASSFEINLAYLNIPLLAGYFLSDGNIQPYLLGGFQFSPALSQSITNEYADDIPSYVSRNQPIVTYDNMEYGVIIEGGIRLKTGATGSLNLGIRYTGSERTLSVNNATLSGGAVNLGTKRVSFTLAYLFGSN